MCISESIFKSEIILSSEYSVEKIHFLLRNHHASYAIVRHMMAILCRAQIVPYYSLFNFFILEPIALIFGTYVEQVGLFCLQ